MSLGIADAAGRPLLGMTVPVPALTLTRGPLSFALPAGPQSLAALAFLHQLHLALQHFVGSATTENSVKDSFDLVLCLVNEMIVGGRFQCTEVAVLQELVLVPSGLEKLGGLVGLPMSPANSAPSALLASPIPWRRTGLKYTSNEIYFDLTETLSYILTPSGKAISGSVVGRIECRSKLSGMPDLTLSFSDGRGSGGGSVKGQMENCAFHPCVRFRRWDKEGVVSFIPPDGHFPLLTYSLPSPATSISSSPLALLPLSLQPTLTQGKLGGSFSLLLTSRAPPSRPLTNIVIRLPIGKGSTAVSANLSGGALPSLSGPGGSGRAGAGAGRWDFDVTKGEIVWTLDQLVSTDRPALLTGQYALSPTHPGATNSLSVSFDSPSSAFSGVRIAGLKMAPGMGEEGYSIYKGVRMSGAGSVEVRAS